MGPLAHILLALATVAADEAGLGTLLDAPLAVVALLPLPHLVTSLARRVAIRGNFAVSQVLARTAHLLPVLGQFCAVAVFGWHRAVLRWLDEPAMLADWPHVGLLLSLVPFAALEVLSIDARARLDGRPLEATRTRSFRLRIFAASAFPLIVYLLGATALGASARVQAYLLHVGLAGGLGLLLLVAALALSFPFALRFIWETSPLRGRGLDLHRHVLDTVSDAAGFRCRDLRLWHTGGQMANAAIVGFLPGQRYVFFSDLLLAQLGPRELAAVFAHEIGHARRHHVAIFACWTIAFFGGVDLVLVELDDLPEGALLAVFAAFFVGWYLVFGYLSRRFELEADLCSVEIAGDAGALVSAFDRISGAAHTSKGTWRHFSPDRRIQFLAALQADPRTGIRLRRRLRLWSALGVVLFLAVGTVQLHRGWAGLPEDRVVAELALGEYPRAAELAREGAEAVDPQLRALAERAASLVQPVDWSALVRSAVAARDELALRGWVDLAALQGDEAYESVQTALREMGANPDG